ncbi:MAG: radical SAM protein [Myxococcales bacterium]|nr:radical SAM protein [Myxococcales bacterium]
MITVPLRPRTVTWIVKLSKFCNLRCAYCYEWDDLANPARMSAAEIDRVLAAARSYHERMVARSGAVQTRIVLHGGEPLVLPIEVLRGFVQSVRAHFQGVDVQCGLQTNLYRVSDEKLDFVVENHVRVSVSFDFVPGVRLSVAGDRTEGAVLDGLERLRLRGCPVSGVAVIASHTAPHVERLHDFFVGLGIPLLVIPLQAGPLSRPMGQFDLSAASLDDALERLFVRWFDDGCRLQLEPIRRFYMNVVRKMLAIAVVRLDRRSHGDSVFVVDTDLQVYRINDVYCDNGRLGSLRKQSMDEILASERYERSLIADERALAETCGGCDYQAACCGSPLFELNSPHSDQGRCGPALALHRAIERYLRRRGVDERLVGELTRQRTMKVLVGSGEG